MKKTSRTLILDCDVIPFLSLNSSDEAVDLGAYLDIEMGRSDVALPQSLFDESLFLMMEQIKDAGPDQIRILLSRLDLITKQLRPYVVPSIEAWVSTRELLLSAIDASFDRRLSILLAAARSGCVILSSRSFSGLAVPIQKVTPKFSLYSVR